MLLTEVGLNPSIYFSIIHNTLWSFPMMNSWPPYLTVAFVSNICTLLTSSPSPQVPFFPITYHYHVCHNSRHMHPIFNSNDIYMIFECCHNIRNQPISTAIPSPHSFHDNTLIVTYQHLGKILKDIFFIFFQDIMSLRYTQHTDNSFIHTRTTFVYSVPTSSFCSLLT